MKKNRRVLGWIWFLMVVASAAVVRLASDGIISNPLEVWWMIVLFAATAAPLVIAGGVVCLVVPFYVFAFTARVILAVTEGIICACTGRNFSF